MVHDTDKPKIDEAEVPKMKTIQVGFNCPPGFEPACFIITAMDKNGNPFTNAPAQPNLALHLARLAIDFATERAVRFMQGEMKRPPSIITAPAGSIPPWEGPAGRG